MEKLAGVAGAVAGGLPQLLGVPLTLWQMWQASPELAKANGAMITLTTSALFVVYFVGIKRLGAAIEKQEAKATSAITESFFAIRTVSRHDIAGISVAFFSSCQR